MTGNHARHGARTAAQRRVAALGAVPAAGQSAQQAVPELFNCAYRTRRARRARPRRCRYQGFFFPLDGVRHWNRLYGPKGLYQHQSVVPEADARAAIADMLDFAAQGRAGLVPHRAEALRPDARRPGIVSFPRAGFTLTLDFPNKGQATLDMLAGSTASPSTPAARSIPTRTRA